MRRPRTNQINEQERLKQEQLKDDYRAVMGTAAGRRLLWAILERGNIFRPCFTGNAVTYFNEGKRELTLSIYVDIMEACPDLFHAAQRENYIFSQPDKEVALDDSDDTGSQRDAG